MKFSTKDQDNDRHGHRIVNCAVNGGPGKNNDGWWYYGCAYIRPNKQYSEEHKIYDGKMWHNYPFIEIKIRPINCI